MRLAEKLLLVARPKQQPTYRRIRALFNKRYVLDSAVDAQHIWEHEYYPQFYIPHTDFLDGVLQKRRIFMNGWAWLGKLTCGNESTGNV